MCPSGSLFTFNDQSPSHVDSNSQRLSNSSALLHLIYTSCRLHHLLPKLLQYPPDWVSFSSLALSLHVVALLKIVQWFSIVSQVKSNPCNLACKVFRYLGSAELFNLALLCSPAPQRSTQPYPQISTCQSVIHPHAFDMLCHFFFFTLQHLYLYRVTGSIVLTTMALIMIAAFRMECRALWPTVSVSSVNGVQILQ